MELVLVLFSMVCACFVALSSSSAFLFGSVSMYQDTQIINLWAFPVEGPTTGYQRLTAEGNQSSLIVHHRCDKDTLLYIWGSAYLTRDGFATAMDPLYVPSDLLQEITGAPVLQSATFAGDNLVMAISGVVLAYDLRADQMIRVMGIPHDVIITHLASFQCCFNDTEWCQEQDTSVVAYNSHSSSADTIEYFLSLDAGRTFTVRHLQLDFDIKAEISGATILGSLSSIAFLITKDNSNSAQFIYDYISPAAVNKTKPVSLPFSVTGNQTSFVQSESGVGSLVIWDSKSIYYSAVSGKAVVKVGSQPQIQSFAFADGEAVRQVVTSRNGDIAMLTTDGGIFFGREGLPPKVVKLPLDKPLPCSPSHNCVMRFTAANKLEVLYPASGESMNDSPATKLQLLSLIVHVQQRLAEVTPALEKCRHQGFVADFHDGIFYLDLGQRLELRAKTIPGAWEDNAYMVAVSNPGILSVNTSREVSGPVARGVVTTTIVAHVALVADILPSGRKDEARGMSTLKMSVHDSSLMCHHKQNVVAHIVAGCPPNRNIRVRKKEEECANMRNYVYTISKDVYDPTFLLGSTGVAATEDKQVSYDYDRLGCPIMVYYQDMLKPVIDLYEGNEFVEEVEEDYIVNEINGMFTYGYTKTAREVGCKSQPQGWLTLLRAQDTPDPDTAWTRQNYRSCLEEDTTGLTDPDQPYEILSSRNSNQLKWSQYNGILVFNVSVLNPDYSLCQLRSQFAVQIYGVLPLSTLAPLRIMLGSCGLGLATLMAFYAAKKLWPVGKEEADSGQEM